VVLALLAEVAHVFRVHHALLSVWGLSSESSDVRNRDHVGFCRLSCALEAFILSPPETNLLAHHLPTGSDEFALKKEFSKLS
jgi:hypothetical protein